MNEPWCGDGVTVHVDVSLGREILRHFFDDDDNSVDEMTAEEIKSATVGIVSLSILGRGHRALPMSDAQIMGADLYP